MEKEMNQAETDSRCERNIQLLEIASISEIYKELVIDFFKECPTHTHNVINQFIDELRQIKKEYGK